MRRLGTRAALLGVTLTLVMSAAAVAEPPSWPDTNPSADAKIRETFVWISAGDHDIPGILALPKAGGSHRTYPAVLMLHGFASHKDEVGDMYLREARALAERGIASLRIDFAGTGDSQQPYFENTWTGMVDDALAAYDWLAGHPRIDGDTVASWSGALYDGLPEGFDALYAIAQAEGSVVLDLGFAVVELSLAWFDTMIASTPLADAAGYVGPVLAVAGSEDTSVDPAVSENFLNVLHSPDESLRILAGADHIYNVLTPDQTLAEAAITITADWFDDRF